jgi:transcriptional regulator with XRE-family HTH domain
MTKLARYLAERRISQSQLARDSGVSLRTVNYAVQGESTARHATSLDTWAKLARALGCNVYEISEDAYSRLVGSV